MGKKEIDMMLLNSIKNSKKSFEEQRDVIDNEFPEMMQLISARMDDKIAVIERLFKGDFTKNEAELDRYSEYKQAKPTQPDEILANKFIIRDLDSSIQKIREMYPDDGLVTSVCGDRRFFIERALKKNLTLDEIKKYVGQEEEKTI